MKKLLLNIGLPKTGTTYLGSILGSSKTCSVSKIKEPSYFIQRTEVYSDLLEKILVNGNMTRGLAWYESLFLKESKIHIDLSTQYWINYEKVCKNASRHFQIVPFMICRNPDDQIESYVSHLRRGYLSNNSLEGIVTKYPDFKEYLRSMYLFSSRTYHQKGIHDGVLYINFKDFIDNPSSVISDELSNILQEDILVEENYGSLEKNIKGYPKIFFINHLLTSNYMKLIGKKIPSSLLKRLIPLRKRIIRLNLNEGQSIWEESDKEYIFNYIKNET